MSNKPYGLLSNVIIIRNILIILLVFYHAFAIYSGAWPAIDGFSEVKVYWWLDKLSCAFMLEMFVFVSGYVFGYQVRTKGECKLEAKSFFWSKFKRLMIPSMFFSLLYIMLLKDIHQPVAKTFYDVVNGVGHMWFLPMLFWCFIAVWFIEKLHLKPQLVLPLLLICSVYPFVKLPLQITHSLCYMFFFYVGYILQRTDKNLNQYYTWHCVLILTLSFFILFLVLTLFRENINSIIGGGDNPIVQKAIKSLSNLSKLVYSFVGLAAFFCIVGTIEKKCTKPFPQWFVNAGNLCMGVYLFHQFILIALYNHTVLPSIFGPYWLPWMGFFVALVGSVFLSFLFNKTRIGRFLIG